MNIKSNRFKKVFKDSFLSILGLMIMNVVAQFAIYPFLNKQLGVEEYGNIIYLLSIMNILAVSAGTSCNYARMKKSADGITKNNQYVIALVLFSFFVVITLILLNIFNVINLSIKSLIMFIVLTILTMWRYYSDVEYRLSLDYIGYFKYYLFVTLGYLIGLIIFGYTKIWELAFLPGELLGLVFVGIKGNIFYFEKNFLKAEFIDTIKLIMVLFITDFMSAFIFNADRILLKMAISGTAVSVYYMSSLLGKTMSLITTPLNSVLIGYLSKYHGKIDVVIMNICTITSLIISFISTIICTIGSYIILPILYGEQFEIAKEYIIIANASQVVYFVANMVTVVLLRFSASRYQIYINLVYVIAFVILCIPAAILFDIKVFCYALFVTCVARLLVSLALGYKDALKIIE